MTHVALVLVAVLAALAAVQAGKLPSYIKVCRRSDPKVEDCILNTVERLRPQLIKGIPELGVPAIDPLRIKELPIHIGNAQNGFHAVGHDVLVHGAGAFKVTKLKVDMEKNVFHVSLGIPELYFTADYDVDAKFAMLPVRGRGPIDSNATDIKGDVTLSAKMVSRDGEEFFYFNSVEVDLKVADFSVRIKNLFRGDTILTEATNNAINANSQEVLATIMPVIERTVGSVLLDIANKITKNISYKELFPED